MPHHLTKDFYQSCIDLCVFPDQQRYITKFDMSRRAMLDVHPNCEDCINEYAELAIRIYSGETNLPIAARMSEIEKTLDSCRLPF